MSPGRAGRISSVSRSQTIRPSASSSDLPGDRVRLGAAAVVVVRPFAVPGAARDRHQREVRAGSRRRARPARHRRERRRGPCRPGEDPAEQLVDTAHQLVVGPERAAERQQRSTPGGDQLLQLREAPHVRATEAVDRLPRVANEEERGPRPVAVSARDQLQQFRLHRVDVLRLVNHQVAEAPAHGGRDRRVVAQQGDRAEFEVQVVERALRTLRRLVAPQRVLEESAQPGERLEGWFVVLVPDRQLARLVIEVAQLAEGILDLGVGRAPASRSQIGECFRLGEGGGEVLPGLRLAGLGERRQDVAHDRRELLADDGRRRA